MRDRPRIEPPDVVNAVEGYVGDELDAAAKWSNRTPLDESGVWLLHALAAHIYALGWEGGECSESGKARAARSRERRTATVTEETT